MATTPPQHVHPARPGRMTTAPAPLALAAAFPLPAGTPIYNTRGELVGTLGESVPAEDDEHAWTVTIIPATPPPVVSS